MEVTWSVNHFPPCLDLCTALLSMWPSTTGTTLFPDSPHSHTRHVLFPSEKALRGGDGARNTAGASSFSNKSSIIFCLCSEDAQGGSDTSTGQGHGPSSPWVSVPLAPSMSVVW
eukprot:CAMPEP_0113951320 /NCGR_PEP_ID=MMETSP1339-20121228/85503_1 /TAXON_ID=94617 /ORGANISM="Fibrocapsa japonica" /LENGTH=113 /DNA_ID=CAMNT_0000959525 /DNA_START=263 /DNA_END=601 /DNA_ORIENTATION=+ /assembly_acc=CAM_ASM_000762